MLLIILLTMLTFQSDWTTPKLSPSAEKVLNATFKNWQILKPRPEDEDRERPEYSFHRCNLNNDDVFDFALVIISGTDSNITENYVALVSQDKDYKLFVLKSFKKKDREFSKMELYIYREATYVANFGIDEGKIPDELKSFSSNEGGYFDRDCVSVMYKDANICDTYIFLNGKFHSFSSCD